MYSVAAITLLLMMLRSQDPPEETSQVTYIIVKHSKYCTLCLYMLVIIIFSVWSKYTNQFYYYEVDAMDIDPATHGIGSVVFSSDTGKISIIVMSTLGR